MTFSQVAFIGALLLLSANASAWPAKDSITGVVVEIVWPLTASEVARDGNHEVQYRIGSDPTVRLGEVTTWLVKCHGRYCPTRRTRTFELNTFSELGLMYCFPVVATAGHKGLPPNN